MKPLAAIAVLTVLTSCAVTQKVTQLGPDTYTVGASAAPVRGGASAARSMAVEEAGNYCRSQGKQILVKNIESHTTNYAGAGSTDVTFRCLNENDPELTRPAYQPAPNVIIQDQR